VPVKPSDIDIHGILFRENLASKQNKSLSEKDLKKALFLFAFLRQVTGSFMETDANEPALTKWPEKQ
jgi:hypothetical protein